METFKTLSIQKQASLYTRLPEARFTSHMDKAKANWIIFGEHLLAEHFERINSFWGTTMRLSMYGKSGLIKLL